MAYPVGGWKPVPVFDTMWPVAQWAPDGTAFHVRFRGDNDTAWSIASVPISAGAELPAIPVGGLKSPADAAHLPGARILPLPVPADSDIAGVALTADLSTAAIVRTAVHRNLYRVPLP